MPVNCSKGIGGVGTQVIGVTRKKFFQDTAVIPGSAAGLDRVKSKGWISAIIIAYSPRSDRTATIGDDFSVEDRPVSIDTAHRTVAYVWKSIVAVGVVKEFIHDIVPLERLLFAGTENACKEGQEEQNFLFHLV